MKNVKSTPASLATYLGVFYRGFGARSARKRILSVLVFLSLLTVNFVPALPVQAATYTYTSGSHTLDSTSPPFTSADDVVIQSGATVTVTGTTTIQMASLDLQSGGTLTHDQNALTKAHVIDFDISGNVTIAGTIDVDSRGYEDGGPYSNTGDNYNGGGGHGGDGGEGTFAPADPAGVTYGDPKAPVTLGSSHKAHASTITQGGGAVKIVADGTMTIDDGLISTHGQNKPLGGWGGGSGGSVYFDVGTLVISGSPSIVADGGDSSQVYGGAGGGGRIALIFDAGSRSGMTLQAYGGAGLTGNVSASKEDGGAGTIYWNDPTQTYGTLYIANSGSQDDNGYTTQLAGTETYDEMIVNNDGHYRIPSGATLTIPCGGTISGSGGGTILIDAGGVLNVEEAGSISGVTVTNNGTINYTGCPAAGSDAVFASGPDEPVSGGSYTVVQSILYAPTVNDADGIKQIQLLENNSVIHTCTYSASYPTDATCRYSRGTMPENDYTLTWRVTDGLDNVTDTEQEFKVVSFTTYNKLLPTRLKAGETGVDFELTFRLLETSGTAEDIIIEFPSGFNVDSVGSHANTHACITGLTKTDSDTVSGTKSSCPASTDITVAGIVIDLPSTPGAYEVTWSNDYGGAALYVTDDDQVTVTSSVDPSISFNVGSTDSCDHTFVLNGGTVDLGTLDIGTVSSSDQGSIDHICTRMSHNAASGAVVTVRSLNAALTSTSTPTDTIPAASSVSAGTEGYGLCSGSDSSHFGVDPAWSGTAATPDDTNGDFDLTCTSSNHNIGLLTTSDKHLWMTTAPTVNAYQRLLVKASISALTEAHDDYADTLTFIMTATY